MSNRFPGRQWTSRLSALGGAHMSGPVDVNVPIIPYLGRPAEWTYATSSLALTVGVPMPVQAPTITSGSPYLWESTPALPAGLLIDSTTGVISGTPTSPSASAIYLISSRSRGGPSGRPMTIVVT